MDKSSFEPLNIQNLSDNTLNKKILSKHRQENVIEEHEDEDGSVEPSSPVHDKIQKSLINPSESSSDHTDEIRITESGNRGTEIRRTF